MSHEGLLEIVHRQTEALEGLVARVNELERRSEEPAAEQEPVSSSESMSPAEAQGRAVLAALEQSRTSRWFGDAA